MPVQYEEPALHEELLKVRELLETGDVDAARALVARLSSICPDNERVRHYARVLAPPEVLGYGPPSRSYQPERDWLKAHAAEHPGRWLAIHCDQLVAASTELSEVLAVLRHTPGIADSLLHFEPAAAEPR